MMMEGGCPHARGEESEEQRSASTAKPRIALAIDDRWRKQGIEVFLTEEGFEVGGQRPELVLADAPRPWRDIREALLRIRVRFSAADLVVFVPELRYAYVEPCLRAGAMGVLDFNSEPRLILAAIDAARRGNVWAPRDLVAEALRRLRESPVAASDFNITRAERRVLGALRDELTNKEIASLLQVSEATVKFHISRLLQKTNNANRHQLQRLAAGLTP